MVDRRRGGVAVRPGMDRMAVDMLMHVTDVGRRAVMVAGWRSVRVCRLHDRRIGRRFRPFEPVVKVFSGTHFENEEEPLRGLKGLI